MADTATFRIWRGDRNGGKYQDYKTEITAQELRDLIAFLAPATGGAPEGPLYVLPGRADEGQLADEIAASPQAAAGQHDDAGETDRQADQTVDGDRLVLEHERGDDDGEQRHRPVEDRGEGRIDRPLGSRDEEERQDDVDDRHDDQVAVDAPVARQRLAGDRAADAG